MGAVLSFTRGSVTGLIFLACVLSVATFRSDADPQAVIGAVGGGGARRAGKRARSRYSELRENGANTQRFQRG